MVAPVVVLGTLSVISGWWGPELASWLEPVLRISDGRLQSVPQEGSMLWEPVLASVLGVLLAAGLYARSSAPVKASPPPSPKVPRTVFIRALQTLSSFFHSWVEVFLIKRTLVGGPALLVSRIGRVVRGPEAGSVQQYLVVVTVLAGAALLLYMGL
jgi:NADH:ubiquinone oxidoreductase subunit 5 (subunit L)/multisubunit Na+/H+ antiporter MnhA subunit